MQGGISTLVFGLTPRGPVNLNTLFYAILVIGGFCAAIVTTVPLWACFSTHRLPLRITTLIVVMPIGGTAYAVIDHYEPLLFNCQWYAAVTSLQALFICLPLMVVRWKGYRFGRLAA